MITRNEEKRLESSSFRIQLEHPINFTMKTTDKHGLSAKKLEDVLKRHKNIFPPLRSLLFCCD